MSLFERSLFMCYMAGAGQITAEAGAAISFLPVLDDQGRYQLSPYGQVCQRVREFTLAHPDVGIPLTPFGLVLDYHHGAYPGFGKRRAFWHFDYNAGDNMTWELIDLIWPGGWEVMGKNEVGTMVNGPFGDTFDVLLQNAPQEILNSYPYLVLSGNIRLSPEELARFTNYMHQGGTLILNSIYLPSFPDLAKLADGSPRQEIKSGKGRAILYGPDYQVAALKAIFHEVLLQYLPVTISPGVEYLVNIKTDSVFVTLINNEGVTKEPRQKPKVDPAKSKTVNVRFKGLSRVQTVKDIKNDRVCEIHDGTEVTITLPPGELAILEFRLRGD